MGDLEVLSVAVKVQILGVLDAHDGLNQRNCLVAEAPMALQAQTAHDPKAANSTSQQNPVEPMCNQPPTFVPQPQPPDDLTTQPPLVPLLQTH